MLGLDLLVGALIAYGYAHVDSHYWGAAALFWAGELTVDVWACAHSARQNRK